MKFVVYGLAGLGLSFLVSVAVGKLIALGNRRPPPAPDEPVRVYIERTKPVLTVVWRDTDVMKMAFTGTVELVGDYHMKVTDENGYAVMVDRRDVESVY